MSRPRKAPAPLPRVDAFARSLARGGADAQAALTALARHAGGLGPDASAYARALPDALDRLAPEHHRAVAELWLRLDACAHGRSIPPWRDVVRDASARVAWWHVELLHDPGALADAPASGELRHAVETLPASRVDAPLPLVDALLRRPEPYCARRALALLDDALTAATAPAEPVAERLAALAAHPDPELRNEALRRLAAPWAALRPRPGLLRPSLHAPATRAAALDCAASWRLEGVLRGALADGDEADARRALVALADVSSPDSFPAVIADARRRGAWLEPELLRFVMAFHQRGVFAREGALDDVLSVIAGAAWRDLDAWATVLYTAREEVLARAEACAPDDARAVGLCAFSLALARVAPAAFGDRAVRCAEALLDATSNEDAAAALVPLLAEAARPTSEAAVLRWLPTLGAEALPAVVACGGEASVAVLLAALGVDGAPAPWAVASPREVGEALYQLVAHDPTARDAMLRRVELLRLPRVCSWFAAAPARARLDAAAAWLPPARRIEILAGGDGGALEAIDALVAEHLQAKVSAHLAGRLPELETLVAPEVIAALAGLTRRLRAAGIVRPRALASDPSDDALAASLLLGQLERAEEDALRAALIRSLATLRSPRVAPAVARCIHDDAVSVRTAAIRAVAARGEGGVTLHLVRAVSAPDIEVARAALDALATLGTRVSARAVTAALEHPNMSVKKTAAAALGSLGDRSSVGAMLGWLGRHDNPGLRAALLASLDALLGPAATPALVGALDAATTAESRSLLLDALDGRLSGRAARAHRGAPWFDALVTRLRDGGFSLRDATAAEFDDLLGRGAGPSTPAPSHEGSVANDLARWLAHGLPAADVPRLLAGWRAGDVPTNRAFALARRDVNALLTSLDGDTATRDAAVRLLGEAFASTGDVDALRPLAAAVGRITAVPREGDRAAHRRLLTLLLPALDASARWALADRWRALPPAPDASAADTLDLLRACGRAVTRNDLDALLAASARTPSPAAVATAVLARALRVTLPTPPAALVARVAEALSGDAPPALEPVGDDDPLALLAAIAAELPWLTPERRALALDAATALRPIDFAGWRGGPEREFPAQRVKPPKPTDPDRDAPARRPATVRAMRDGERTVSSAPWLLPLWLSPALDGDAWLAALADDLRDADARHDLAALGEVRARLRRLAAAVGTSETRLRLWRALVPPLASAWSAAPDAARDDVKRILLACPEPMRAALLTPMIASGQWGLLALLHTSPVDSAVAALVRRARADGYQGPAPIASTGVLAGDAPSPPPPPPPQLTAPPPRAVLDAIDRHDAEVVRRALKELAREGADALRPYLERALADTRPRVRDLAARLVRTAGTRDEHLARARERLHDRRAAVRVSAIRSLSHARDADALPALVAALFAPENAVRKEARLGLARYGDAALDALDTAARRERPDRARRLAAERELLAAK
ncbi:MAG: HEAT repeat domain-containing protein [Polyangiales bacterium]